MAEGDGTSVRRMPPRSRSTFLTRTATDDTAQLNRRWSIMPSSPEESRSLQRHGNSSRPYQPRTDASDQIPRSHTLKRRLLRSLDIGSNAPQGDTPLPRRRSSSGRRKAAPSYGSISTRMYPTEETKDGNGTTPDQRLGASPRPVNGHSKLGTFSGVFVPTSLNVLSILMFLRFGFILGQSGFLGMMGMLLVSYLINLVTTFSLSAIATNGTVRGGGAYYLISRSLGPEFGGSIGVVFYIGSLLNTSMNAVGLIDCFKQNFGNTSGNWAQWLPEGYWWDYLWATAILVLCTGICLAGSGVFARFSNGLLALVLLATFSIPCSVLVVRPFQDSKLGTNYPGPSIQTLLANLKPRFTKHAAGSQLSGRENFRDLFGILFPATGGIFAGASMSGDLKHPSKAIPKGTLGGLALTFFAYSVVILAIALSISRETFYNNVNVIQDVNVSGILILLGEFATGFFSALMGVIGSAKLLQALARDNLLPGFGVFGQGTESKDEPTYAILMTYVIAQVALLSDINQLASFVTMTYLMTFLVTNLACFLLKVSSAPNFRPSFRYFNWSTAVFGTVISGATMFFVDAGVAAGCTGILIVLFLIIHYFTPPKSWGDVSQSLIYHQVRKYLLRLRQEHVKFWRPQILLFVNDPRHQYKLIQFCNALKKGALFVLGHVIVSNDFGGSVPEARRQQAAWNKYIDFSSIKAFVNIAISPAVEWGTRNIVLSAGLGGMRPNIVIMGFYDLDRLRKMELRKFETIVDSGEQQPMQTSGDAHNDQTFSGYGTKRKNNHILKLNEALPTDVCRTESDVSPTSYVTILEDMLLRLQINFAIAKGFQKLEFPVAKGENTKKYIDLWPIQMSAEIASKGKPNVLTTNFDTYTLILQLGCILDTVPVWKKSYTLRVAVFVEYESDVEEERGRVKTLLENLRIKAEVLVFWLASGHVKTYQVIVNGTIDTVDEGCEGKVDEALKNEEWWQDVQRLRGKRGKMSPHEDSSEVQNLRNVASNWPSSSFCSSKEEYGAERFEGLRKLVRKARRRPSSGDLGSLGLRLGMRTHRLHDDLVHRHASYASASEDSESDEEDSSRVFDSEDEVELSRVNDAAIPTEDDMNKLQFDEELDFPFVRPSIMLNKTCNVGETEREDLSQKNTSNEYFQSAAEAESPADADDSRTSTDDRSERRWESNNCSISKSRLARRSSGGKSLADPVPDTELSTNEAPGPSIIFTDHGKSPTSRPYRSIYNRRLSSENNAATGFPVQQSIPLGFNVLPSRAQHLILNELMRRHSKDTAVLFTTLPSPVEGTCNSEESSVDYLSDLEVLCDSLPPVLLVHSNSMTVTMNL